VADYYVKNAGLDSNTGLSDDQAWKTLAGAITNFNAVYAPGDSLLAKWNNKWYEAPIIGWHGATGQYVTLGAYGDRSVGDPPLISGQKPLVSGDWSLDSGDIWKATVAGDGSDATSRVFFGGVRGLRETAKVDVDADFKYYCASNVVYVYATANPATYYSLPIEVRFLTSGWAGLALMILYYASYVKIEDIKIGRGLGNLV
jgi:hypothetical protein